MVEPFIQHRILVTGSRGWTNRALMYRTLRGWMASKLVEPGRHHFVIVHGGAAGADTMAGQFANSHGVSEEVHYAQWSVFGKRAGHVRNERMVAQGAEVCFAFWDGSSRGTADTIALAKAAAIDTQVVTDG